MASSSSKNDALAVSFYDCSTDTPDGRRRIANILVCQGGPDFLLPKKDTDFILYTPEANSMNMIDVITLGINDQYGNVEAIYGGALKIVPFIGNEYTASIGIGLRQDQVNFTLSTPIPAMSPYLTSDWRFYFTLDVEFFGGVRQTITLKEVRNSPYDTPDVVTNPCCPNNNYFGEVGTPSGSGGIDPQLLTTCSGAQLVTCGGADLMTC